MMEKYENRIPVVIGVTGHRNLKNTDENKLKSLISMKLSELISEYKYTPFILMSSLAEGADSICAEMALSLGIPVVAALPMEVSEYEKDFEGEALTRFRTLLESADTYFVTPETEPKPDKTDPESLRDYYYRQAGIYVAYHSHVLFAIWDGKPGTKDGCGTAEAVSFMLNADYNGGDIFKENNDGAVIHFKVSRDSFDSNISVNLIEKEPGSLQKVLKKTDIFNKDCLEIAEANETEESALVSGEKMGYTERIYHSSDCLSLYFQKKYYRAMKWLSVFCVLLVLAYLIYDEAELPMVLLGYGAVCLLYFVIFKLVQKKFIHRKYLEYRMVSEVFRVQSYMDILGIDTRIGQMFTWTQKHSATWIKEALNGPSLIRIKSEENNKNTENKVKESWITGQKNYHLTARKRDGKKHTRSEALSNAFLIASLCMFVLVSVLEFAFSDKLAMVFAGLTVRIWLNILWGCLTAVALFVSEFYGRLSLERKSEDHEKMSKLFACAEMEFDEYPEKRKELFTALAREEIIDNGNWISYCKEDKPNFSI